MKRLIGIIVLLLVTFSMWPERNSDTVIASANMAKPAPMFTRVSVGPAVTSGGPSQGVAWADYDNDGYEDLVVTNMLYPTGHYNWLYRNNGSGGLLEVSGIDLNNDRAPSRSVTWGDIDNNGFVDLFITNLGSGANHYYYNDAGTLTGVTGNPITDMTSTCTAAGWVDYDSDGDLDIYISRYGNNGLFRNNEHVFIEQTSGVLVDESYDSYGLAWSDYDNDGDQDVFVAVIGEGNPTKNNHLYRNEGGGTFLAVTEQSIATDNHASAAGSWGDYDSDGDMDLFVTNLPFPAGDNSLYQNEGNGSFAKITYGSIVSDGGYSFGSTWGDFDNDGDLDLFVANYTAGASGVNFVYLNNGDGTFDRLADEAIATDVNGSTGCAAADYDLDGDLDIFVANSYNDDEDNVLYVNNCTGKNWLCIKLTGLISNRSGIGARINLFATAESLPAWQTREISGQTGYCSQSSLIGHFGLGDVSVVDSIRIDWPSGIQQVLTNVAANQILAVTEACCGYYTNGYTGNTNCDEEGVLSLSDITRLIDRVYISKSPLCCEANGNVNGSMDGLITLSDITRLIDAVYVSKSATEACL